MCACTILSAQSDVARLANTLTLRSEGCRDPVPVVAFWHAGERADPCYRERSANRPVHGEHLGERPEERAVWIPQASARGKPSVHCHCAVDRPYLPTVFVTMRAAQLPGLQVRARVPGLLFGSYCRRPKITARSSRIVGQRMLPTSSRICTSMPSLHTSRGHTVVPPRRVDVSAPRPQLARGGHRLSLRVPVTRTRTVAPAACGG